MSNKIKSLVVFSHNKRQKYDKLRQEKERMMAEFDAKLREVRKQIPVSFLVGRIARALKKKFGYAKVEVLGPFGLGCHTSIHLYRKKDDTIHDVLSITFEYEVGDTADRLSYLDYSRRKGQYAEGTLGSLNGLDYPLIDATNMSIDELHDVILASKAQK